MDLKSSLTPLEVAELLKITKNTVYELIKRGELPSYKIGKKIRIDMHDVEDYINNQKSNLKSSINRNTNTTPPNNKVENTIYTLSNNISLNNQSNSEIIISGQDILLDILARYIEEILPDYTVLRSYKGSYNGLYDLYNNKVSIASCHLWDGDRDEYNTDYVKRLVPGTPCVLINLAYRLQGFYVEKGNPLNIKSFEDLTNKNITGKEAENLLDSIGITVNKNTVPNETRSPFVTSGIRIGTAAVTTRGFDIEAMKEIASIINDAIENRNSNLEVLRERVKTLCAKYPLYSE